MLPVVVTPAAQADIAEIEEWYSGLSPGLGHRFLLEVKAASGRISSFPESFAVIEAAIRRAPLSCHFPYGLYFEIRPAGIVIIACLHDRRDPVQWQRRRSET
jgi:plasmid stabilization system protein ParE